MVCRGVSRQPGVDRHEGPNPETPLTEEEEEWDELEEAHIKDKKTLISDFSIWRSLVRLEASCFS